MIVAMAMSQPVPYGSESKTQCGLRFMVTNLSWDSASICGQKQLSNGRVPKGASLL